jgi:Na+/H+ antiporter NhaB
MLVYRRVDVGYGESHGRGQPHGLRAHFAQVPRRQRGHVDGTSAGNLTLIGSVANLIVAEQALKFGIKFAFTEYLRAGIDATVVVTVLSLLICIAWLQFVV